MIVPGMAGQGVHSSPMACCEVASLQRTYIGNLVTSECWCSQAITGDRDANKEPVRKGRGLPAGADLQASALGKQQRDGLKVAV